MITTAGDRPAKDTPWGEGAFVTAIEDALVAGDIDLAVHSAKDVPTDENPRLDIAAYLPRESAADVLVMRNGVRAPATVQGLPAGARIGTDSPRRTAFLRSLRPDLILHPLHGNVDTRLRRLDEGETDVLVLAEAGLRRLGRADRIGLRLSPEAVPPAPGQGALALQVRADDARLRSEVSKIDDPRTRRAVEVERALLAATGGGCRAPVGAYAVAGPMTLELLAGHATPDGSVRAIVTLRSSATHPPHLAPPADDGDDRLVKATLLALAEQASTAAIRAGGRRVVITRDALQAPALALALVDRGLAPIMIPAISIEPGDEDAVREALGGLATFDWVVLSSANAVRALMAAGLRGGDRAAGAPYPRWATVGAGTSWALAQAGIAADHQPGRSSAEDLANTLPVGPGARVLLPQSDIADHNLRDRLEARGAHVVAVTAYRTVEAPPSSEELLAAALGHDLAAVTVTSGSTARGLLALAARIGQTKRVQALPAICIGPETALEARRIGYSVAAEAPMTGPGGIADAAVRCILGAAGASKTAQEDRT